MTLGIVSLAQISKVNGSTVDIATNWLPSVQTLGKLAVDASAFRRYELAFLLSDDESARQTNITAMNKTLLPAEKGIDAGPQRSTFTPGFAGM